MSSWPPEPSISHSARRHPLVHDIARGFQQACGSLRPGPTILAVSGGRDSLALLVAAAVLRDHADCDLLPRVVHVHHHLRRAADDEAAHVMKIARALDIPGEVIDIEVVGGTPAEARRLRYDALQASALRARSAWVATGHHAEDQLETVLAALGRGAGPTGLAGMPRMRSLGSGVTLIRPLLHCSRSDAADLCTAAGVDWCDDPGNADPHTQRGRLRRDVTPVLESMFPGVAKRVAAMTETQSLAAIAFEGLIASTFGSDEQVRWSRESLRGLPAAVIATGLRRSALASTSLTSDTLSHSALASSHS